MTTIGLFIIGWAVALSMVAGSLYILGRQKNWSLVLVFTAKNITANHLAVDTVMEIVGVKKNE